MSDQIIKKYDAYLEEALQNPQIYLLNVGGTFNPTHIYHLHVAQAGFKQLVKQVLMKHQTFENFTASKAKFIIVFMVAKQNVLKEACPVSGDDRLTLLHLLLKAKNFEAQLRRCFLELVREAYPNVVFKDLPEVAIQCIASTFEINQEQPSYSATTAKFYRGYPQIKVLAFILGIDSVLTLPNWYRPNIFLELIDLLFVVPRGSLDARYDHLKKEKAFCEEFSNKTVSKALFDLNLFKSKLVFIEEFKTDFVMASVLRKAMQKNEWDFVEPYLCPQSIAFIKEKNLYTQSV